MSGPSNEPPRLAERLLIRFVPVGVFGRSIVGDAREEYAEQLLSRSRMSAALWYWKHVLEIIAHFGRNAPPGGPARGRDPEGVWRARIGNLLGDIRVACRSLVRKPGFSLAAVVTLGLGIGANTTMFSVVYGVLIRPLPYPDAEQLVGVYRMDPDLTGRNPTASRMSGFWAVPYEVFRDWSEMSSSFESIGGYFARTLSLTGGERPERVAGAMATSGVFEALGVGPIAGRTFLNEDDAVGSPGVAILSHGLWQRRFGSDLMVLGQHLTLSGLSYEVVGVMPPHFGFPYDGTDIWLSFEDERKTSPIRDRGYMQVIARLREGVSLPQARVDLESVALRIGELHPEESEHGIILFSRKALETEELRASLVFLLGAVGLVLLIACANIANLLLVRASERKRELGVRMALGADRTRLLVQFLSESVVLSLTGGAAGVLIALVSLGPLKAAFPGGLPRAELISVDFRMLVFAGGLSLLTGLLTGLLPAIRAMRTPSAKVLQEGSRGTAGGRQRNRVQTALVVSEIALAFVLLVGAGLFIKSLTRLTSVESGFDTEDLLVMGVSLPARYRESDNASVQFFDEFAERLRAIPGVRAVGGSNQMPFVGGYSTPPVVIETSDGLAEAAVHETTMSPEYFSTLGIPVVLGRGFLPTDEQGSMMVTVVNQAMVDRFWPGESPLGRRIGFADIAGDSVWVTVVGVIGDVRYRLNMEPFPAYHLPLAQWPHWYQWLVVRTAIEPTGITPAVREALAELDPDIPATVFSLEDRMRNSNAVAGPRFGIFVLSCLAGLAALLSVVGVYGVLAYTVQQRAHEIGIRLALGAGVQDVLVGMLRRGLFMAGAGLLCGIGLALGLSRIVEGLLFEVNPTDPMTLAAVSLLVAGAATVASFVPARRATKVDPIQVLRQVIASIWHGREFGQPDKLTLNQYFLS